MNEQQAKEQIELRLNAGGTLAVAGHADLASVKNLRQKCLDADIPALLGPAHSGG